MSIHQRPRVSVIIPSHNRLPLLRRVLAAYQAQAPADLPFEVVVVDDGSGDGTADFLAGWRPQRYRYRFAVQANSGPARARNRGLALASGELVLFTGDDILPTPDLLAEHLAGHRQQPGREVAIVGLTRWPEDLQVTATMRHIDGVGAQQFSYHYFEDGAEYDFRHLYTSNISLWRHFLDLEPSYFSTAFARAALEDAELGYRLSRHGLRILYRASAVAHHYHHYEAPGFFRRQQACGEMAAVLLGKFPELRKWLGVEELEWTRLRALAEPAEERRRTTRLIRDLPALEQAALRLAALFDPTDPPAIDGLLAALFRHSYLSGLAEALYPPADARRLSAWLYQGVVVPALRSFAATMEQLGVRVPSLPSGRVPHEASHVSQS